MIRDLKIEISDYKISVTAVDGKGNTTSGSFLMEYKPDAEIVSNNICELAYWTIKDCLSANWDDLTGNGSGIDKKLKDIIEALDAEH